MSKSTKVIAALGVVAGLGVAALPAFTYAATADAEVEVTVTSSISIAVEGTDSTASKVSMAPNELKEGGEFKSTIKVTTNNVAGYDATVKAKAEKDVNLTSSDSNTIPAASGTLTAGTAGWGYRVGTSGDWVAVTTTEANIKNAGTNANGYTNDATVVEYGVATASAQPTGTYSATLTYTATAK